MVKQKRVPRQLYLPKDVQERLDTEHRRLEATMGAEVSPGHALRVLLVELERLRRVEERVVAVGVGRLRGPRVL